MNRKYLKEMSKRNESLPKNEKKFLKPCEKCHNFPLLDFDICPMCNHQQSVDDIN